MARHNVDKNPVDFEAHYNLGAMLQGRGDLAGAEKRYAIALSIRPEDATVNNAIAGANLAAGHPDVAVTYLQTALRSRPDYFDALYNLGAALAMQNNFVATVGEFLAAVLPQSAGCQRGSESWSSACGIRQLERSAHASGKSPGHRSHSRKCA